MKNFTIYDIAREANVSTKTVSRVLNNQSGVGKEVRERIRAIMDREGYHPHLGARSLRGERPRCIGVTLTAPFDQVPMSQRLWTNLLIQLQRIFSSRGEYVTLDLNPYAPGLTGDYARGLWEHLYKACVLVGPLRDEDTVIERVHASGMPYLSFGRLYRLPELNYAVVDYEHGAMLSMEYLLARGHRHIAMISPFPGFQPEAERRKGYETAMRNAGEVMDDRLVRPVSFAAESIASTVHRLLADRQVTALIDSTPTEDASALREGARRAGRRPGKDFEIVAWTYSPDAVVLPEARAHVWLPLNEAVAEGLERLAAWANGENNEPIQVVYRPILSDALREKMVPKPERLFEMLG